MALTEVIAKDAAPLDVPEAHAVVVMSATLVAQWAKEHNATVEWGDPVDPRLDPGQVLYSPVIHELSAPEAA
jgi:hypothetical protein